MKFFLKEKFFYKRQEWERNLIVLWFGTFMAGVGFSLIMPFMSLYIDTLGSFSHAQLNFWSGCAFSSTFLLSAIISPLWGRLADEKGRKLMLLRASFGMAITISLMGLVTNVYQLVLLRAIQGLVSGYISNATALIATCTPREKSGQVLGVLTTGNVTGGLLGPLIGGIIASSLGYRITFFVTGSLMFLVFLLTLFFVKETFVPVKRVEMQPAKEIFKQLPNKRIIMGMFLTTLIIQASNNSISPILSLYVRELIGHSQNIALISGVVASIPGIATLIAAPQMGRLGDRIGSEKILKIGLIFAILVFIPMAFVQNVWQLGVLRFFVGISDACLLPGVQTLITKNSPRDAAGRIFSYNQSFQAMGNVVGPFIGSTVAGFFDYRGVFLSTAGLVGINFLLVKKHTKSLETKK